MSIVLSSSYTALTDSLAERGMHLSELILRFVSPVVFTEVKIFTSVRKYK